jgi:hypothetical protein
MLDKRLIAIEQKRGIVEPWAILSKRLTADDNRRIWNQYDWSQLGEEWTPNEQWKTAILSTYVLPNFPQAVSM